jgi:hypothetical protein
MYSAEDVTELLNSHKQVLTLNNLAEIHTQNNFMGKFVGLHHLN